MPIPTTTDKSVIWKHIQEHHPEWSKEQKVAVMLSQARKAGANIPKLKRKKR